MEFLTTFDPSGQVVALIVAIALGLFVGLRREISMQQQHRSGFIGIRTMPFVVLFGAVSTFFPDLPYLPAIAFIGMLGLIVIAYADGVFRLHLPGLTSELSALLMFVVGVLVGYQAYPQAVVLTVFVAGFSAFKTQLHSLAKIISPAEWAGALQLLIVSAVVLPLLPKTAIDPWGVLVPFTIWLIVIFVAAIGFAGYFLNKFLGSGKSILLTAFFGAFVSSTAVSIHLATEARKDKKAAWTDMFAMGIVLANTTMLIRLCLVMAVLAPAGALMQLLMVPGAMIVASIVIGGYLYLQSGKQQGSQKISQGLELDSPFEIVPALKFAGLFVVVLYAIELGQRWFGDYGVLVSTFLAALADVDAASISAVQALGDGGMTVTLAGAVIAVATVVNTWVKVGYVAMLSSRTLAWKVLVVLGIVGLVGVVVGVV